MANDLLMRLLGMNVAAALAVLAVLALRKRGRAAIGAQGAYALWLIVPAVMLASLLPPRTLLISAPPPVLAPPPAAKPIAAVAFADRQDMPVRSASSAAEPKAATGPGLDLPQVLVGVWLFGIAVSLILLVIGQRRALAQFGRVIPDAEDPSLARASNPRVGPALLGTVRPKVIVPADFETQFDAKEQAMVLAHERTHLARGHALINAFVALIKAIHWFNPFVHLAARCARVDQELACDAAVMERFPGERQTYAQALLKTQLTFATLPLGCDWPVRSPSRLEERIEMLAQDKPGRLRLHLGAGIVATLVTGAGFAAWASQPPVTRLVPAAFSIRVTEVTQRSTSRSALGATSPLASDEAGQAEASRDLTSASKNAYAADPATNVSAPTFVQPPQIVEIAEAQPSVQAPAISLAAGSPHPTELSEPRAPAIVGTTNLLADAALNDIQGVTENVAAPIGQTDLHRYEGYYQPAPYVAFHIFLRGGQLRADSVFGGPDADLSSADDVTFIANRFSSLNRATPARITFTFDAKGQVTGLVLRQGGRDWAARKIDRAEAFALQRGDFWTRDSAVAKKFLEQYLGSIGSGKTDSSGMSPSLAAYAKRGNFASQIRALGPLKSVHFVGMTRDGSHRFTATFEHSRTDFLVSPSDAQGKIDDLLPLPATSPSLGGSIPYVSFPNPVD